MGQFPSLCWALALALASTGTSWVTGCGKAPVDAPVTWYADLDVALASGKAQDKPILVYFGATWDSAAKELEHETFPDPEVSWLLRRNFVSVHVDSSDDEAPLTRELQRRFKIVGDPTIVILGADGVSEIARYTEFVPPRRFARVLRAATRPEAVQEAHFDALARRRVEEARAAAMSREYDLLPRGPTVTITIPPEP